MTWLIALLITVLFMATLGGLNNRDRYGKRCPMYNSQIFDHETICKKCASGEIR